MDYSFHSLDYKQIMSSEFTQHRSQSLLLNKKEHTDIRTILSHEIVKSRTEMLIKRSVRVLEAMK